MGQRWRNPVIPGRQFAAEGQLMAIVFTKGDTRTESPRLKNTPRLESAGERSADHDALGRFAPGNKIPHKGIRSQIRKSIGNPDDPNSHQLVKDTLRLYFASVRELPSDGPAVRALVAASARHSVLAAHLANLALEAGLATADGLRLSEASRAHDQTAQRLSVTAYDRAVRDAIANKNTANDWRSLIAKKEQP